MADMRRKTFALRIKPNMKEEFKKRFGSLEPELITVLNNWGVKNFSVWCIEDLVFGYFEEYGDAAASQDKKAIVERWRVYMQNCYEDISLPGINPMRLMYEDIGIVREDKTKIRHRVFVTRLKPGCAEEYKRRHDDLIASRNGKINEGPESNFTIWYAENYIFGYCELDKSMEKEPTEEERQAVIAWETRMLEIMDWLTDDVDWLTGLKHDKIEQLFSQG